jgi:DNA-binding GntR family transcriptional regulator
MYLYMTRIGPALVRDKNSSVSSALPRQTLVETAVSALRQRILRGEFKDGEPLNQVAIAREYDISRIPLREAMRRLEAGGLLIFHPGKGAVVSSLSLEQIREVVDLRSTIEPDLLGRAIPHQTSSDVEEARGILDQFEAALKQGDVAVWGELNWRFHSTLYAPSGRRLTMEFLQRLHHIDQRYARVQIALTKWERRAAREHRQLLAVCVKREQRKAATLLKDHILSAGHALIRIIEEKRGVKDGMADTK